MNIITRDRVLQALSHHIGKDQGVSAENLVIEIVRAADLVNQVSRRLDSGYMQRQLREVISDLRAEGHHIGAHPSSGYYICSNDDELNESCLFLYDRAMTSLKQISAMKKIALPDLAGQLKLPT